MRQPRDKEMDIDYVAVCDGTLWWPIPFRMFKTLCEINGTDIGTALEALEKNGEIRFLGFNFRPCTEDFKASVSDGNSKLFFTVFSAEPEADAITVFFPELRKVS